MYDIEAHHWPGHEDVELVDHNRRTLDKKEESEECVTIHQNIHHNDSHDCNFCGEKFASKRNMMEHKKRVHIEMVALCWNFSDGKCGFGDDFCSFSHSKVLENFNCNICEKVFKTKNEIQYHQKH